MKKSLILTIAFVFCFSASFLFAGDPPKKVGLAIPEAGTDKGWNEQGKVGVEQLAKTYGYEAVIAEALGYGDITPTLRDMARKGCDLIFAHASGYQTVVPEVAKQTGVKMTTTENHAAVTPGLISDIDTQPQAGTYLAGWLAGKMTRSKIVGIVTSGEPPTWNRMAAGFAQGLKETCPDCKLLYSVIGEAAYADAAGAKRNTEDQIAVGADVIFGMGDGASFGMLQACSTKKARDGGKIWFIDVIGDKTAIDKADVLLTSVLFDMAAVYDEIIQTYIDGTFGKQHWVSLENGGIKLLDPNKGVPADVRQAMDDVKAKVTAGKVDVVDIPDAGPLHDYFAKEFPRK